MTTEHDAPLWAKSETAEVDPEHQRWLIEREDQKRRQAEAFAACRAPSNPNEINLSHLSRADWLEKRKLGSSDAAAICGLNPWRSPLAVWAEKTGLTPPTEETEAMRWGTKLEPVIAEGFAERTGLVIQKCQTMFVHSPHDFLTATPDYEVFEECQKALLEIKNVGVRAGAAWEDGIPDLTHIQVAHQLMVSGYTTAYVAGLIGGNKLAWKKVERSERLETLLLNTLLAFWDMVQQKTPPPARAADSEILSELYPESKGGSIPLPPSAKDLIVALREAEAAKKHAEKEAEGFKNQLKQMLGDAERGTCGDITVSWKTVSRKSYTVSEGSYRKLTIIGGADGEK